MLRALLLLYPAAFRAEYGRELASDFEFRMKDGRSPFYRLLLGLEMIGDVLISAAQHIGTCCVRISDTPLGRYAEFRASRWQQSCSSLSG